MWNAFAVLFLAAGLGACTIQESYDGDTLTGRTIGVGLSRTAECNGIPQAIRTTTLGLNVAQDGASLGYFSADLLCIPQECRAVFFVEDAAEAVRIREMIGDPQDICVRRKP
ncbi:MAG TPA: hypothetical protein VLA52_01685 [Thermohalobaculum sp.]|nr:hypothetical protein [Thermohalobaculum sp.]